MLNTLVIVWRESLEAMLVIGVLLAWIARQPEPAGLRNGLWLGVGAGLALAAALGLATYSARSEIAGQALDGLQLGMRLFASLLIVHMVLWMHRHGRHMKRELEARATGAGGPLGLAAVAALAVGREGAETMVFLYGLGLETAGGTLAGAAFAAGAGALLAAATAWLVARGARHLNYRTLFRASEILLLLIAHSLLANALERMVGLDWLPPILDPAWDISALLDDSQGGGRLLADFTGYRARPTGLLLAGAALYWSLVAWRFSASRKTPVPAMGRA